MAKVLNLNRFRKRQKKTEDQAQAERNRVIHGRTKAEKRELQVERERAERALDGHAREGSQGSEDVTGEVKGESEPEGQI